MKIKLLLILVFCFTVQFVISQNCEAISPYKEGTSLEYTNYNKKGKVTSVENYYVKSVSNTSGELVISIESKIEGKKKKEIAKQQTLRCVDGNFYVDMSDYLTHQNEDQKSTLEIKAEGDFVEFPSNLNEGLALEDGNLDLKLAGSDGASDLSLANMKILNRKVLKETSFSVGAEQFDAYKMSFDYVFSMGFIKVRGSGIEWYVKGVGIVKTESYNKKGKLRWTRTLTNIKY